MNIQWLLLPAYLLNLALIPRILLQKKRPASTLAWIWALLLFPYLGALAYLVLGTDRIRRVRLRRRRQFLAQQERTATSQELAPISEIDEQLLGVISRINNIPITHGNEVELLLKAEAFYSALIGEIEQARHHIHLQFYIWRADEIGARVLEALEGAARRGVQVRLLVDEIGSWRTSSRLFEGLRKAGGQFAWFLTLVPHRKLFLMNLRNHRKLVVIDGQTAFLGGMNVGDEYMQRGERMPVWLDAQMRMRGPVVLQLQEIFTADWFFATAKKLLVRDYYPQPAQQGRLSVQLVSGGPDNEVDEIHLTLVHLINQARKQIQIVTPYFVPDNALLDALRLAAYRKVEVKLLFPAKSDHPWLQYIARSFYEDLLAAGVQVFEFKPGFLHAKMMTIDSQWSMIGSANLDIRSFRLNFELNALIPSHALAQEVNRSFKEHFAASTKIQLSKFQNRPWRQKFLEALLRPFAPVS
jgi:cardiolipin synthase